MSYLSQLLIEAIFVGISLILVGNVVGFLVERGPVTPEAENCALSMFKAEPPEYAVK